MRGNNARTEARMLMETQRICPNCRKPLPPDVPLGLCPECLIKSGFPTETEPGTGGIRRFVPPPVEEISRLFPQFEILGFIGKGGMGAVYKARQPGLDRLVALKVLPPAVASDPSFAERFTREARALARLNHPNIVAVYDFGKAGALHYLVMEFVDGANLREVERTRLSPDQALAIVPQICEALQFAHNEGIVHRDIKPENLLLDKKGRLKITDFGIAKILDVAAGKAGLTGAKDVVGTPHYMAPEQIEKPQTVDHRADIYSLGVVFYEMLTGELPLGKFAPPSKKAPVDARLDEVVLHTLEKEPERRYQKASEVKTDVETISGTQAKLAQTSAKAQEKNSPAPTSTTRKWLKILGGVAAAGLLLFLIAAIANLLHNRRIVHVALPQPVSAPTRPAPPVPAVSPAADAPPAAPIVPVSPEPARQPRPAVQIDGPAIDMQAQAMEVELNEAQMELTNIEARYSIGTATSEDADSARDKVEILKAQLAGDDAQVAKIRVSAAQRELDLKTQRWKAGLIVRDEVTHAQAALDLAQIQLKEVESAKAGAQPPTFPAQPAAPALPSPPTGLPPLPSLPQVSPLLISSLSEAQMRLTNLEAQFKTGDASSADLAAANEVLKVEQSALATEATQLQASFLPIQRQLQVVGTLAQKPMPPALPPRSAPVFVFRIPALGPIWNKSFLTNELNQTATELTNVETKYHMGEATQTDVDSVKENLEILQALSAGDFAHAQRIANDGVIEAQRGVDLELHDNGNNIADATYALHAAQQEVVVAEEAAWMAKKDAENSVSKEHRVFDAEERTDISQSFDVGPRGKLTINVDRGTVRIVGTDGNTGTVHMTRRVTGASDSEAAKILKDEHVVLEQNGNEISITAENPPELQHSSFFRHPNLDVQYEITLPRQFGAHVETSGGDISLSDIQGSADIRTMGGQIVCDEIAGNINAHTMGGDMRATECKGRLDLETMGGRIVIEGFAGPEVHATTSGGSVSANFAIAPTEDCDLETMGGNITVELPETAALRLDGHTFGGSEKSDFPVEIKDQFGNGTLTGAINGGGPVLTMQTQGGNVEVRKK